MSSAAPQADVTTFSESGASMEEPEKDFPICKTHLLAEVSVLGTFRATRKGVAAELSISTCKICRPMLKSSGRFFRARLCLSAPGLDSFRKFILEKDFEFFSDVRAWTINWQKGGLAYGFFEQRSDGEKWYLNRDQTLFFIFADLAREIEKSHSYRFYD